jgi:hypothetical protein
MTILVSLASQSFAPQTRNIPFTVAADVTQLVVTFTHGDWPEGGPVLRCTLLWGGVPAGNFTTSGGVVRDKAGNPTGGTIQTTLSTSKPPGFTSGVVEAVVLQTFISAILVESF